MIFYFTGTGNSLQIARNITKNQNEKLVSIAEQMNRKQDRYTFTLEKNEIIGFVFPIYAWNPPRMVLQFIEKLGFSNYSGNYIFSVATCGDNIGNTMKTVANALKNKGLPLDSGFSVQMPNNYIVMFDVDPKTLEEEKLSASQDTLNEINRIIAGREKGVFRIVKGPVPSLFTALINPMFNRYAIRPERFYVTEQCTGCGICKEICNCRNITLQSNAPDKKPKPVWGGNCTQCLACFHYCPVKAIQYGKGTVSKGRYRNPAVNWTELSGMAGQRTMEMHGQNKIEICSNKTTDREV